MSFYGPDLAHVHHEGFGDFAQGAAPGLLAALRRAGIRPGRGDDRVRDRGRNRGRDRDRNRGALVLDLGCGAGQWLAALSRAGYDAQGIEISPALARLARREAPRARVRIGSIYTEPLPRCDAVTALGEVLGYLPHAGAGAGAGGGQRIPTFAAFFRRVAAALRPGGLFAFDLIVRNPRSPLHTRNFRIDASDAAHPRWAVLAESIENPRTGRLTRDITIFRRVGRARRTRRTRRTEDGKDVYRRSHELHHVRVPARAEILRALAAAGFTTLTSPRYGRFALAPHRLAFLATRRR